MNTLDENVGAYPGAGVKDVAFILRIDAITESGDGHGEPMDVMLEGKREENRYEDVLDSLKREGFVRPVSVIERRGKPGQFKILDGNHRLAAASDLGWGHVLAAHYSGWGVANDSGMWREGDKIPTMEEANND